MLNWFGWFDCALDWLVCIFGFIADLVYCVLVVCGCLPCGGLDINSVG